MNESIDSILLFPQEETIHFAVSSLVDYKYVNQ